MSAQCVVLGLPHAVDGSHQNATFASEVAVNFFLESRFKQISRTHCEAEGASAFGRIASGILIYGKARVDALTFEEQAANRGARTLGGHEDDIDILAGNNKCLVGIDDAETVGEIKRLARSKVWLDEGPVFLLPRIRKQVLHHGALGCRFFDGEEGHAGLPAVLNGEIPRTALVAQTDDDIEAVVTHIERLATPLNAITQYRDGFLAKNRTDLVSRIIRTLVNLFRARTDADFFHDDLVKNLPPIP